MIIKSLELHNFRQFMDDEDGHGQKIIFSTDPDKKATLLIAKNATGKTTLLQSFSWIFYGEATGIKSIINVDMKNDMLPSEQRKIEGIIVLEHLGRDYVIDRYAMAQKFNVQVRVGESFLKITYTDEDGNSKELLDYDATSLVTEIVPKDLFPYFFFQGENIEAIGQKISSGKSSGNSKFVKAIRGMLGFNWLYNEQTDLKAVIRDYQNEIAANSTDKKTQELQTKINTAVANIEKYTDEKTTLESSLEELKRSKEEVSDEIIKSGDVADKQRETIRLGVAIERAEKDIEAKRKGVFSDFSEYGYRILAQDLIKDTLEFLKENNDDASKGVPGMEARAIRYVLDGYFKEGECFCGQDVNSLSEKCKLRLEQLIKYLPPNNLGESIKSFESTATVRIQGGDEFLKKHRADIETIANAENSVVSDKKRKSEIDEEIKSYPDMAKKKERERKLENDIFHTGKEIARREELIRVNENTKASAEKEKEGYRSKDERVLKLTEYEKQATKVYERIKQFCERKEKEKKEQLQNAINEIFNEVFDVNIMMELDANYNMKLRSNKHSDLIDFQNSTSQDAILAFAFIGGIIKLAREKVVSDAQNKSDDEELANILDVEPYPLVMDAPSSSFDTDRIESFCRVMPNIAEQVIFFIKDTDGNYVKEAIKDIIGKEYTMEKTGQYATEIKEVR